MTGPGSVHGFGGGRSEGGAPISRSCKRSPIRRTVSKGAWSPTPCTEITATVLRAGSSAEGMFALLYHKAGGENKQDVGQPVLAACRLSSRLVFATHKKAGTKAGPTNACAAGRDGK